MRVKVSTLFMAMLAIGVVGCSTLTAEEPKNEKSSIDPRIELGLAEAQNNTVVSGNDSYISPESESEDSVSEDTTLIERHEDSPIDDGCLSLEEFERLQGTPEGDEVIGFTDQELEDMNIVNNAMREYTDSEEFQALDLDHRKDSAEKCLQGLEVRGLISDIFYSNYMFTFKYKCGVSGGWMIKDFDPYMN